jgi:hypothetical protein
MRGKAHSLLGVGHLLQAAGELALHYLDELDDLIENWEHAMAADLEAQKNTAPEKGGAA